MQHGSKSLFDIVKRLDTIEKAIQNAVSSRDTLYNRIQGTRNAVRTAVHHIVDLQKRIIAIEEAQVELRQLITDLNVEISSR